VLFPSSPYLFPCFEKSPQKNEEKLKKFFVYEITIFYMVKATCLGKTSGMIVIEVKSGS